MEATLPICKVQKGFWAALSDLEMEEVWIIAPDSKKNLISS